MKTLGNEMKPSRRFAYIIIFLLLLIVTAIKAQSPNYVYVMQEGETLAVICAHPSIDMPVGDTVYITCYQIVPTATATNTPTPLPTATNTATNTPTPLPTATNTPMPPTATFTPTPTDTPIPQPASERGRVQIVNNNVVADNGQPLRGEHVIMSDNSGSSLLDGYYFDYMYDQSRWYTMRDDYHLNTIRLLISRPPQNWTPALGDNCAPPAYRCLDFNYVMPNGKTMIEVMDDMVDWAAALGMYIIIDYHPVGGHNTQDALDWWSFVAPRYANRTHVIYEAVNEPVAWSPANYTAADVQFEIDIYQHIRNLAPNTHIILWSFGNATADMRTKVDEAPAIDYSNASVAFHPYEYADAHVIDLRNAYPAMSSETGNNRDSTTAALENLNVSWIWLDGVWNYTPAQIVTWGADPGAVNMGVLPTPTSTPAPTNTPTPTANLTPTPTNTPLPTPTNTPLSTPTHTPTPTNSYQYFPTATTLNGSTCLSIPEVNSLWSGNWSIRGNIYLNQSQVRQPIIAKQGQSTNERGFWLGIDNGNLYLELYHSQTDHTDITGSALPIAQWVNIEARFVNGIVTLFINNIQVAQNIAVPPLYQNNLDTQLGCYVWDSQYAWYFDGRMQNVILTELP